MQVQRNWSCRCRRGGTGPHALRTPNVLPVHDGPLAVRGGRERSRAVRTVHELVDLIVEHRLVAVHVRAELLGERVGVGGEDAGKVSPPGQLQHLALHEVHRLDVFLRGQLRTRAHHEGVQYLVLAGGQLAITAGMRREKTLGNNSTLVCPPNAPRSLTGSVLRRTPKTQTQ